MNEIVEFIFPIGLFLIFLLIIYIFRIQPKAPNLILRFATIGLISTVVCCILVLFLSFGTLYIEWKFQQTLLWMLLLFSVVSFLFRKELIHGFHVIYRGFVLGMVMLYTILCIVAPMGILLFFDINKIFTSEKGEMVYHDGLLKVKYEDGVLARSYSPIVYKKGSFFLHPIGQIIDFPREEFSRIDEVKQIDENKLNLKMIQLDGGVRDTLITLKEIK